MVASTLLYLLLQTSPEGLRLECTADTSICMHDKEEGLNHGGRAILRMKGIHNLLLMNFDVAPIRGKRVEEARLYLRAAGDHHLKTLGLSSVSSPWNEGRGNGPAQPGESCFLEAARAERPWAYPGSTFLSVSYAQGGSIWFNRDLRPEADGWISVEIPPALLHALLEGKSHGIAISDDKGQTMANNDLYSREQNSSRPYLLVTRTGAGPAPPSGARLYSEIARPDPVIVDRGVTLVPKYVKPQPPAPARLSDGTAYKILHEGDSRPEADAAGRLWDGRSLALAAARGEHVGFLVAVEIPKGETRAVRLTGEGWAVHRVLPVEAAYDPLVPVAGEVSGKALFHVERHVPKTAAPGAIRLALKLSTGRAEAEIPGTLRVHGATLPDALTFHVSLNAYGFPAEERAFYRMAHEHRATLCVLPYSQRGKVDAGTAPELKRAGAQVEIKSWAAFDARFGPYFDGTAFQGLPREGTPMDHFYLPFHENWPLPLNEYYGWKGPLSDHWKGAPPIEKALPPEYGQAFAKTVREVGRHLLEKKWTRTDFHVFLNNKPFPRQRGDAEGAWWCLDEPVTPDDFQAIRHFGLLFKQGAKEVPGAPMRFRIDLSRPQWRRDHLDGVIDLDVIAGIYREYPRFVFGRGEDVWVYGGAPSSGASGESGRAWAVQSFLDGANGLLPWQSLGSPEAWTKAEDTALLLPPGKGMEARPYATLRLKSLRRGQQDAELLGLLLAKKKWARPEIRKALGEFLLLQGTFRQSSADDAGRIDYGKLDPDRFEALRRAVLTALD